MAIDNSDKRIQTIVNKHTDKRELNCKQGKHKLRENNFGVVWCVNCGLLSNTINAPKLVK